MVLDENRLRELLAHNNVSIGGWLQLPSSDVAEIVADYGFDWVCVDMEHGSFDFSGLPNIFRAIESKGSIPIVRCAGSSVEMSVRALEAGARGLLIPRVESVSQMDSILKGTRYPPFGARGYGFNRRNLFGKYFDSLKECKPKTVVIAMIESVEGAKNLESILTECDVDGVFVGPYDLSASLGSVGNFASSLFKDTLSSIIEISKEQSVPIGIHSVSADVDVLKETISQDQYDFVAFSTDTVLLRSSLASAEKLIIKDN